MTDQPRTDENTDDVEQRVIEVICRTAALSDVEIRSDSRFADLAIDSLEVVNICFELEQEFGIEIPNDRTQNVDSVQQVVTFVRLLSNATQSSR